MSFAVQAFALSAFSIISLVFEWDREKKSKRIFVWEHKKKKMNNKREWLHRSRISRGAHIYSGISSGGIKKHVESTFESTWRAILWYLFRRSLVRLCLRFDLFRFVLYVVAVAPFKRNEMKCCLVNLWAGYYCHVVVFIVEIVLFSSF